MKYKEKYQANLGHTNYNINTPEFARVKANQRFVSQVSSFISYRDVKSVINSKLSLIAAGLLSFVFMLFFIVLYLNVWPLIILLYYELGQN